MTCPECGSSAWRVVDSNGAEYPEPRVEVCQCPCGNEFRQTLTPDVGGRA